MSGDVGTPLVSVVIPAYNAVSWIGEALESVRAQSIRDIEIVVVDDASTDGTADRVSAVDDPRVRLVRLEQNSGSGVARNRAIEVARGEFVALMDADDIALPHWLERQVKFLKSNFAYGLVGAWIETFGTRNGIWTTYEDHEHIKSDLLFRCGMNQNTVVFRRHQFRSFGLEYNPAFRVAQDYELWTRCVCVMRMHNTQEVLVRYRIHASNVTVAKKALVQNTARKIRARQLDKLGISVSDQELALHDALGEYGPSGPRQRSFNVNRLERWLLKLRNANEYSGYVSRNALSMLLYEYWRRCCRSDPAWSGASVVRFITSDLTSEMPLDRKIKDAVKMLSGRELYSLPRRRSFEHAATNALSLNHDSRAVL